MAAAALYSKLDLKDCTTWHDRYEKKEQYFSWKPKKPRIMKWFYSYFNLEEYS